MQGKVKKKRLFYILSGAIGCFVILMLFYITKRSANSKNKKDELYEQVSEPVLGVYDRHEKMTSEKAAIKHFLLTWNNSLESSETQSQLSNILKEKKDILLTIEMWSGKEEAASPHGVLQGMINGDYDKKIEKTCAALSASQNIVYLRWNPEMEVPVNKYPWQQQSSYLYVSAFRHFAQLCKKHLPKAKIVWGPLGYAGTLEYWPGADVTDFASITLNNLPGDVYAKYPAERSIPIQVKRKLHRLRFIDKPVFLIGSEQVKKDAFKNEWLQAAINDIQKDTAVIYSQKNFVIPVDTNNPLSPKIEIGVFDPQQKLAREKSVSAEHLFADFTTVKNGVFKKDFDAVLSRNHNVIVSMEPWKDTNLERDSNVLINTINGKYDKEIRELYKIISNTKQFVYLRWAHEMEIPIVRYPWQSQDPVAYIKAYRYFMNFNKNNGKNICKVWGPAGDRGSLDWWPGNDVVDYISIAIYGLPDKDITDPAKQESFSTIFKRKYNRMRFVNKPIFITEFGVKGPQSFKQKWLDDAAKTISENPQIIGVNYFNFSDSPKAWGKIEPPDWSITKETFLHFTKKLERAE
jgi:beta-mannanase